MKKIFFLISGYLLISQIIHIKAQEKIEKNTLSIRSDVLQEKIVLLSDRTIYSVNENIFFKASYLTNIDLMYHNWSTVLYIELVQPDGNSVLQAKYPLNKKGSSGTIHIPEELHTGVYYLTAYTKWMRNYPINTYAFCKLKILNPSNSQLASVNSIDITNNIIQLDTLTQEKLDIEIIMDKFKYSPREKIKVLINPKVVSFQEKENYYCISIIKKGTKSSSTILPSKYKKISPEFETANYYPEINGIVISGKVSNNINQKVEENAIVNITFLNGESYFVGYKTNYKGEFFLNAPYFEGTRDFFITTIKDDRSLNIEIDKDFCNKPFKFKSSNFELSDTEKKLANEICINTQITNAFKDSLTNKTSNSNNFTYSFYGTPNKILYTKDYIDLPNIEEFIFELIGEVFIKYKKGKPSIHCRKENMLKNYPFLVMIDNIPVTDLSAFLNIKLNKVEQIELIDNGYIIGNLKYSGIINAITKDKNMAGIKLPKNSMFSRYKMYNPQNTSTLTISQNQDSRIPDRRNCLYWNPSFKISQQSENSFSFQTSDIKGEYHIVVQSVSKTDGKIMMAEKTFIVE